jgi:hypothetical protein
MKRPFLVLFLVVSAACSGSSPSSPSGPQLSVGGNYDIRKTIVSDSCGQSSPGSAVSNPGEVRHTAGATTFVLNDHGTRDLPGTLSRDGSYTMASQRSLVMDSIAAVDTFENGRFTASGFEMRVTTDLASTPGGGPACRIVANWAAAKQGSPNVIP